MKEHYWSVHEFPLATVTVGVLVRLEASAEQKCRSPKTNAKSRKLSQTEISDTPS